MEFRRRTIVFDPLEGSGPRVQPFTEVFPRNVATAVAGIAGYSAGFPSSDRPFGLLEIGAAASVDANTVTVDVTFGLRDWSQEWDDPYSGIIDVVIVAELEAAGAAPAREDLQVTGLEITQATQFFRSGNHLDAANVMPDNSIRLIADKPTGVRVYVDYDAASGLPAIAMLSGELEVQTTSSTNLIAPNSDIAPGRDSAIDRGNGSHTLNFLVPEEMCRGDVTFRCRVFDSADPSQASAAVSRSTRFNDAELIRIFVVGVNYTGQGLNLPAPTLATFMADLGLLESCYPTPGALLTGYTTLANFNEDMSANVACGTGFTALNRLIADLKGDSDDTYVGALPPGVNFGSFTGCANQGVASGLVGSARILAHEVGHRYGRAHAPCDSPSRCSSPGSPDDDYPVYGNYPSDSIGEFGYDPVTDTVFDPVNAFDFMGYTGSNNWVSPYTYTGLMSRTAPTAGGAAGPWRPIRAMTLFLDLSIDRQRRVSRRPSFHFPAVPRSGGGGCHTPFSVEFLDDCHGVLACHPLPEDCCSCGSSCWPRSLRGELPLPSGARWLVVWEDRTKVYEECIPDPPAVSLDCNPVADSNNFRLDWAAVPSQPSVRAEDLWFLVQWQDTNGAWRGLMPRTRERSALVPVRLFGSRRRMAVRVLATAGLATGMAQCVLARPASPPQPVTVVITGAGPGDTVPGTPVPVGPAGVRADAVDEAGRAIPDPGFVWFDGAGRAIARGRRLNRRALRGVDTLRLVATKLLLRRATPGTQRWSVHRNGASIELRQAGEPKPPYSKPAT